MSDEELFALLQSDKAIARKAFDEFYHRYADKLFTYCKKILSEDEIAEDIFQETFLKFFESSKTNKAMSNVPAFLFRIARNKCLNEKQRKSHTFIPFDEYIYPFDDNTLESNEKTKLLEIALDALMPKYKEVLILKEIVGLSYIEIADIMEVTLPAVRIKIYRAKQKIREQLAPYIEYFHEE